MKITNYLLFNGNCREAFEFYARLFDGQIAGLVTYRDMPGAPVPEDWLDKVMNVQLSIGDQLISASDAPPQYRSEMGGFYVSMNLDDLGRAERMFNALADGGSVNLPFAPTAWAKGFGMVRDRFATPWMISSGNAQK
jgi:PhnB protein